MNYRTLGKTGLRVSELGYGAWGIGKHMWVGADDAESARSLQAAVDAGVNFIDTALAYGDGHSERLVGQVVRGSGEQVYVATKIPPANYQWPARPGVAADEAFPGNGYASAPSAACPTWAWRPSTSSSSMCGPTSGWARGTGPRPSTSCAARARSASSAYRSTTTSRPTPSAWSAPAWWTRCR